MIEMTTGIGFPGGTAIGFEELEVWTPIALAILAGTALVIWLFRARNTDETPVDRTHSRGRPFPLGPSPRGARGAASVPRPDVAANRRRRTARTVQR